MARWHVIPILAGLLIGGAAQAYSAPGGDTKAPTSAARQGAIAQAPYSLAPLYRAPEGGSTPVYPTAPPILRPSPNDPYAGVTLPTQRGDGAYLGGGMVLEQDDDGVNRRVR